MRKRIRTLSDVDRNRSNNVLAIARNDVVSKDTNTKKNDMNLVAVRQHIECISTYRVCDTYLAFGEDVHKHIENLAEIYIAEKGQFSF